MADINVTKREVIREARCRIMTLILRDWDDGKPPTAELVDELTSFGLAFADAEFNTAQGIVADAYLNG